MQKAKFDACLQQSRFPPKRRQTDQDSGKSSKKQTRGQFYKQHFHYVNKNRITVEE